MTELSALILNEYKDITFDTDASLIISAYRKKQRKFYSIIISSVFCVIIASAILNINTGVITKFVNSTGAFLSSYFSHEKARNYNNKPTKPTQSYDNSTLSDNNASHKKPLGGKETKATESIGTVPAYSQYEGDAAGASEAAAEKQETAASDNPSDDDTKDNDSKTETESVAAPVFAYKISNGAVTVTAYNGTDTNVTIPSKIENLPVRTIGAKAFSGNTKIEGVEIPSSVQTIDKQAFCKCRKLSRVTLPETLLRVNEEAFYGCGSLKEITVPAGVSKLGAMCFGYYEKTSGSGTNKYNYDEKVKRFTIRCYSGSRAYTYAVENGFAVVNLGSVDFPTSVYLDKYIVELSVGSTYEIKYTVDNPKGETTFTSDKDSVAKVSADGKVTALKKGSANITVSNNGVSRKLVVIVE
ncbi:MAG: leucine-rich repeat protein [Ruminococcus sp.]|nr:leucine-rich repeat protein [Ruminococcus sp.]